jgi:predicted nuclease with TOPRIM domain
VPQPSIHKSDRFIQAAQTEHKRLERKRSQLSKKREDLQAKVDELDAEMEALDQEIVVLEGLTSHGKSSANLKLTVGGATVLRGAAIREIAVPLLMHERGHAPVHYREWLGLLEDKHYEIHGKRPDAVFLNQVIRSPLVRATTNAGYYQLDLNAPEQLSARLRHEQEQVANWMQQIPTDAASFERHHERERELKAAVAKTERELREALKAVETFEAISSAPSIAEAA